MVLISLTVGLSWRLVSFYRQAFYPHTTINGTQVDDLDLTETIATLKYERPHPSAFTLSIVAGKTEIASTGAQLAARYDYDQAVPRIFTTVHQGSWYQQIARLLGLAHESYSVETQLSPLAVDELLQQVAQHIDEPGNMPSVSLTTTGNPQAIVVNPGKQGKQIDLEATRQAIVTQVQSLSRTTLDTSTGETDQPKLMVVAVIKATSPPLTETQIIETQKQAQALVGKKLQLKVQNYRFEWDDRELVGFLSPPDQINTAAITHQLNKINGTLPNQPVNAEFEYDPQTLKVSKFSAGKDGLTINQTESLHQITQVLKDWLQTNSLPTSNPASSSAGPLNVTPSSKISHELILPAGVQHPAIPLEKTNNIGLKQLVGFGESFYAHSIPGRVKNVALTAQRINLTLVKPGEEFSFNKTLGEVSAATGFSPAYVIRSGRTELGDGGGVCQVSSTLFRAAMNGGLNITRRLPHSYRVSYYELNSQAGFDATVYAGNVDFRFKNDTPGYLLIATETDSAKLWMKVEIYGTSDGRTATISDYKSWGATPPLATQYIPDASLPHGQKKQIDWSAAGLKTSFMYTVHAVDGSLKQQETYASNYHPWAAKYLVGI